MYARLLFPAVSIAEVAIAIAVFDIAAISIYAIVARRAIFCIVCVVLGLRIGQCSVFLVDGIILIFRTRCGLLVVVTLEQIEAVQVVVPL